MTLENQLSAKDNVLSPDLSDFIHQDRSNNTENGTRDTENGTRDTERTLQDSELSSFCKKGAKPEKQLCGQEEKDQQTSSGQAVDADQLKTAKENELPDFLLQLLRPVPVSQLDAPDSSDPHESETQEEQLPGVLPSGGSVAKRSVSQILDSLFLDLYEEDDPSLSLSIPVFSERDFSADQHPSSSEAADGSTVIPG